MAVASYDRREEAAKLAAEIKESRPIVRELADELGAEFATHEGAIDPASVPELLLYVAKLQKLETLRLDLMRKQLRLQAHQINLLAECVENANRQLNDRGGRGEPFGLPDVGFDDGDDDSED